MDNAFMNLIQSVEIFSGNAKVFGYKKWFEQTWDYGGASKIGEGILLNAIVEIQNFKMRFIGFDDGVGIMHNSMFHSLTNETKFMVSKSEVMNELNEIIKLAYFEGNELQKIKTHINKIKGGDDIYFDCRTGDCDLY